MERELKLWRSDDYAQIKNLIDALDRAEAEQAATKDKGETPRRLGDAPVSPLADAIAAHNAFLDEAEPRMITVKVRSLGPLKLQRLRDDHTTERETKVERTFTDEDGREVTETRYTPVRDVNQEAFAFALVKACLVDPGFASDDELDSWIEDHGVGTFAYLYGQLNEMLGDSGAVGDPKLWRASEPTPTTVAT
jgi:hypothetical protein